MPNLLMLIGVPGSGKSTWARTFFDLKYTVVSSDEIRKRMAGSLKAAHGSDIKPWDVFYEEIEDRLRHDVDVIADATFLTTNHRDRLRGVASKTGAKIHAVVFKNIYEAEARNFQRDDDAMVPPEVMEDMHELYFDMLARLPQENYDSVTKITSFA